MRAAPPDRAPGVYLPPSVESVGSESDSEYESDQIVRVTKSKSNRKKNKQVPPSDVPFGTYLKDLIFGKQKHESVDYEVQVQEKHRGRSRHKHAVSSAEMPLNHYMEQLSPLVHEYQKVDLRRTKSVDRYEGTGRGHARARSASRHVPKEHRSKRNEHEYRHYERTASSEDEEEKAYEVFETYMSDGLPMREHEQRYRARARDKRASMQEPLQAFESFEPPHFSDNSKSRRRERRGSQIAMPPPAMPAPPAAQQYYTEPAPPVRPRDPDEVIVTTERYVYNNKDGTQTHIESRRVSEHHEHEHEHGSNGSSKRRSHTSSRPSNRFVTHEDQANYYHDVWAPRDHGRRASMAEPVPQRAQSRQQSHSLSPENTSTTPVPGSFVDIEEAQAYYDGKEF